MSDSTGLPKEHPSTYLVQDRGNLDEMTRLFHRPGDDEKR